jgi:hypothetical protein
MNQQFFDESVINIEQKKIAGNNFAVFYFSQLTITGTGDVRSSSEDVSGFTVCGDIDEQYDILEEASSVSLHSSISTSISITLTSLASNARSTWPDKID